MGSQITVTLRLVSEHLFRWWRRAEDLKPDLNARTAATNQYWGYWVVFLISLNTTSFACSAEVTVKRSACLLQQVSRMSAVSVGLLNTQGGLVVLRSTEAGACREARVPKVLSG